MNARLQISSVIFTLIIGLSLFSNAPAYAQTQTNKPPSTPISAETANTYYQNCNMQRDPRMKDSSQDAMCACNAAKMQESLTMEDMNMMFSQDEDKQQESRNALNKMLINVYAPCMNYPVQDMIEDECLKDPQLRKVSLNISVAALCECVATKTGTWMASQGRQLMAQELRRNPNLYDPITPIMQNRTFQAERLNTMTECLHLR